MKYKHVAALFILMIISILKVLSETWNLKLRQ